MPINNANEAADIVSANQTIEGVLAEIEFAARRGRRSWLFCYLPEDLCAQLKERGFHLDYPDKYVVVRW